MILKAEKDDVLKLHKAIYGLKQSSKQWHKKFKSAIEECGFKQSNADPCLFSKKSKDGLIFLLTYVDDFIITARNIADYDKIEKELSKKFNLTSMGECKFFLGMRIHRDRNKKTLSINQAQYISKIADDFKLTNSKPRNTPMHISDNLKAASEREIEECRSLPYREIIGCLNYVCTVSRPDIAYSLSKLARYLTAYNRQHWNAAKSVLKYLLTTKNLSLTYKQENCTICGYTDADWAGNIEKRKSTSGYTSSFRVNSYFVEIENSIYSSSFNFRGRIYCTILLCTGSYMATKTT